MKNLFSERYGYQKIKELRSDKISESSKKRLYNLIQKCFEYPDEFGIFNRGIYGINFMKENKLIEILWDEFFKEDIEVLRSNYVSMWSSTGALSSTHF